MKGTLANTLQKIFPFALILFGLLFMAMGIVRMHHYYNYAETTAEIVAIHNYYDADDSPRSDVYVRYTVDGETYDSMLDESRSSYRKGQTVTIRYNPDDPANIITARLAPSFYPMAFGLLVITGGLIPIIRSIRRRPVEAKPPWES